MYRCPTVTSPETSAPPSPRSAPEGPAGSAQVLLDPVADAQFRREGFVKLPIARVEQVDDLRAMLVRRRSSGVGFQSDLDESTAAEKADLYEALREFWQARLDDHLVGWRAFMTGFLVKWPGPGSDLYLHQDWTYVDERRSRSASLWLALDDTSAELDNGPVAVLPGSHLWAGEHRGSRTTPWYASVVDVLAARLQPVSVRAGEAILLDNRLLHASAENRSGRPRRAIAAAVAPADARLLHAVAAEPGFVDLHEVDHRFFFDATPSALGSSPPPPSAASARAVQRWAVDEDVHVPGVGSCSAGPDLPPLDGPQLPWIGGDLVDRLVLRTLVVAHRVVGRALARGPEELLGPFHDTSRFSWAAALEASADEIAAEVRSLFDGDFRLPSMAQITDSDMPNTGEWSGIVLRNRHGWIHENAGRLPATVAAVTQVPHVRSAVVSVLGANSGIAPHRGPNRGVLRAHLGLQVPGPPGCAALQAGGAVRSWAEGELFVFDDTFEHAVWNGARERRLSLMIEFDRPLPAWATPINRTIQQAFRWYSQERHGHRRLRELDAALNPPVAGGSTEPT